VHRVDRHLREATRRVQHEGGERERFTDRRRDIIERRDQRSGNAGAGVNGLNGYNVHSIVLQAPITQLTANSSAPADPKDPNAVIGVWSTASRKSMSVLSTAGEAPTASGDWVQISRLGSPLVNEAVIPIGHKDLWNSSQPKDDGQFLKYVQDPEPSRLLNALYKIAVPPAPRDDLVAIFLTGIPNATMPPNVQPSEQLRLNVAVPVSATPNRMGVLGGDLQGYPNGRRLNDDVVDISLQALAGAAYPLFHAGFKADPLAGKLGDGVDGPSVLPLDIFPYVASPYQGYDFSGGVAAAPNITGVVGAPASGIAELGASASGTLTGSTGGAYTSYQISNPSGAAVKLTLTYTPVTAPLGKQIAGPSDEPWVRWTSHDGTAYAIVDTTGPVTLPGTAKLDPATATVLGGGPIAAQATEAGLTVDLTGQDGPAPLVISFAILD